MSNSDIALPVQVSAVTDTGDSEEQSQTLSDDNRYREAILYIGQIDRGGTTGKTVNGVVTRLRDACEKQSRKGSSKWKVEWRSGAIIRSDDSSSPETYHVATILRRDGDKETPEFDIFEYSWAAYLRESWERRSIFVRIFRTILSLLHITTFIRFFKKLSPKKAEKGQLQLVLAVGAVVVVLLYSVLLVWAGIDAIDQFNKLPIISHNSAEITLPQWIMIVMTILGIPAFTKLRSNLSIIGSGLLSASAYLRTTDQRGILMHGLSEQAERFRENNQYRSVTIISYSFGTVLAIDALFPKEHPPERAFEKVEKLVTIGSAIDFVVATDQHYLDKRYQSSGIPKKWINVYAPIDLLGSSFNENPKPSSGDADKPDVVAENKKSKEKYLTPDKSLPYDNGMHINFRNALEFYGFTSHSAYWGVDDTPDRNVFMLVLPELYPEKKGHLR